MDHGGKEREKKKLNCELILHEAWKKVLDIFLPTCIFEIDLLMGEYNGFFEHAKFVGFGMNQQ